MKNKNFRSIKTQGRQRQEGNKMMMFKKQIGLLAIAFVFCLTGCSNSASDDSGEKVIFSYTADELFTVFHTDEETLTMNRCVLIGSNYRGDYDKLLEEGSVGTGFFKDKALTQKFLGSDIINANTAIFCDVSINGQGPKIGTVTGTVKLTDFPSNKKFKLYLFAEGKNWWSLGKVSLADPVVENGDMALSFPVYDKQVNNWGTRGFEPSEAEFSLLVLTETAKNGYNVPIPPRKWINSPNEDIGSFDPTTCMLQTTMFRILQSI